MTKRQEYRIKKLIAVASRLKTSDSLRNNELDNIIAQLKFPLTTKVPLKKIPPMIRECKKRLRKMKKNIREAGKHNKQRLST